MSEMIDKVAQAMKNKRRELIAQPLDRIWAELAKTAIETLMSPTDQMMQIGEGYCDFIMPEGFDNSLEGRVRELKCGYQVALGVALELPEFVGRPGRANPQDLVIHFGDPKDS